MRLNNNRYEEIKKIVVATLEKFGMSEISIDCFELAHRMGIIVIPFSELTQDQLNNIGFCEGEAIMFCLDKDTYIFYNDIDNNISRQRFSIFHEIGHYVLGHKGESDLAKSEADFFARYVIAPIPLLWKLKCLDVVDIKNTFNTSYECAAIIKTNYDNWIKYGGNELKTFEEKLIYIFKLAQVNCK